MKSLKGKYSDFWEEHLEGYLENTLGDDWSAHSPFREDHNASLFVNIDSGLWLDFGDDKLKGDAVQFLELRHGISKEQAQKKLSKYISREEQEELDAFAHFKEIGCIPAVNFQYIEVIKNGIKNRKSSDRIITSLDYPDYYGQPKSLDCHHSVCHHNIALPKYVKANDGSVSGYTGACRINEIPIDIDSNKLLKSQKIAQEMVLRLGRYGFRSYEIQPHYSGNRGIHILLNAKKLEVLQSKIITPKLIGDYLKEVFSDIPEFDDKIYKHNHLIRSTNSIHPKSGLYKIPLKIDELFKMSSKEIKKLAEVQRKFIKGK